MSVAALIARPAVARVLALLDGDGETARVVGGAVRNALLDRPDTDVDVATTALPTMVIARAKAAGLRAIPTGLDHGTVTLLVGGRPIEVTTLREDVETDGRHAVIRFGRDYALDAQRRDFTINALSVGRDGTVHDYVDGLPDIAAGRVRFIGDPAQRIREDYLRVLRFFRFSADYAAGPLDEAGLTAAIAERAGLARLSRERVRGELLKTVAARKASAVTAAMAEAGLLGPLIGTVPMPRRLASLAAQEPGADALLRLAALAVHVQEDAERLRAALRLSNAEAARLAGAARVVERLHEVPGVPPPRLLRELLFDLGRQAASDGVRLARASHGIAGEAEGTAPGWAAALAFLADTPEPRLPFSGADLVARGVRAGPAMGALLKQLQADWIRAGFPQEPHALATLLDKAVAAVR